MLIAIVQSDISILKKIGAVSFILLLVTFFGFVGVVGQGWNRFSFKDDIALYKEVKKKYKWKYHLTNQSTTRLRRPSKRGQVLSFALIVQ
jgi:hypothetical protein